MKCWSCGAEAVDGRVFCPKCSADLRRAPDQPKPQVQCLACNMANWASAPACSSCKAALPTPAELRLLQVGEATRAATVQNGLWLRDIRAIVIIAFVLLMFGWMLVAFAA